MKKILLILITFICTTSIFAQNSFHESFKPKPFVQSEQSFNYSQPNSNFELVKNQTSKEVWVDEGWGHEKMVLFWTGTLTSIFCGGIACLEFLYPEANGALALTGGIGAGIFLIPTIIALCIPNEGHYEYIEYIPISKIQNNPILSNIVFATNIQKTVVGYNINL